MAFIPCENVIELAGVYNSHDSVVENVFHITNGSQPDLLSMEVAIGVYKDWFDVNLKGTVPATVQLIKVLARDLTVENGLSLESTSSLPITGTNTNAGCSNNVTLAVKWQTGYAGRSYRGRTYFIGLTENNVTGDTVAGSYASGLQGAFEQLMSDLDDAGFGMGVLSRYHNNAPRTAGVLTPITSVSVDTVIDSQRRRLQGRGR